MNSALLRFWKLLDRTDRWRLGVALFFVLMVSILEMIGVGLLPIMVATLSNSGFVVKKIEEYTHWHGLDGFDPPHVILLFATVVGVYFLMKNLFSMWTIYRQGLLKAHLRSKLGCELIHGYLQAPYVWHLSHSSADIQHNMLQELGSLFARIISPAFVLISEGLVLTLVVCLLLWVAPLATVMAVGLIFGTTILYTRFFRVKLHKLGQAQKEKNVGLYRSIQQGLGGIKELKVLGRTDYFDHEYARLAESVATADEFHSTISINVKAVLELVAVTSLSLILATLVLVRYEMQSILPSLALFAIAAIRLMPSANRMMVSQTLMSFGKPGFIRLMDDIEEIRRFKPDATDEGVSSAVPWSFNREINLSQVCFRYPLGLHRQPDEYQRHDQERRVGRLRRRIGRGQDDPG
jgi:ABC-type multidrug transport system fused ATPase/permease subunit